LVGESSTKKECLALSQAARGSGRAGACGDGSDSGGDVGDGGDGGGRLAAPLDPPPGLLPPAAVFTLANAAAYEHSGGPVGRATATVVLKRLRAVSAEDDVCLTDGNTLDWRAWKQNHSQRLEIIGAGITRFKWHRFPDVPDPDTRGDRCDFIVHRQDRTAVRLHAHSGREDPPVYGFPCMCWSPPASPAESDVANSHIALDAWRVLLSPRHLAMIPPVPALRRGSRVHRRRYLVCWHLEQHHLPARTPGCALQRSHVRFRAGGQENDDACVPHEPQRQGHRLELRLSAGVE